MAGPGFAIIDVHATGSDAEGIDRVVEVAVVHADVDGRVTGAWDTLVNPCRGVGATSVHGIADVDVRTAPTFAQIAPRLVELLAGRVLVAHNARFDTRFLIAELTQAGLLMRDEPQSVCTMRLAADLLPGARRSRRDCCDAYDIELGDAPRAAAEALATAELLRHYLAADRDASSWSALLQRAADHEWPPVTVLDVDWVAREAASAPAQHYLQRIAERTPVASAPGADAEYLALLDRCLVERTISRRRSDQLVALAADLGIDRDHAAVLHRRYFDALVQIAWEDGVLTAGERADLGTVAALLQVEPALFEAATAAPPLKETRIATRPDRPLVPGDLVAVAGETVRARAAWEQDLRDRGFVPAAAVTRQVRLVIAADVDVSTGRARKAREYGIPIVDERSFADLVGTARPTAAA